MGRSPGGHGFGGSRGRCTQIPFDFPKGGYLLLFDPLDGSSNIDVNVSVGTIFSVLRNPAGQRRPDRAELPAARQRAGRRRLCDLRPSTQLVLTVGKGVHAFTLDREMGSFIYTHPYMTVPEETNEFAINASNARHWEAPVQRYIAELQEGKERPRGADFNMRWVASMVADVHRVLTRVAASSCTRWTKVPCPGRQAAPDVRGQSHGDAGRAGWRRSLDRTTEDSRRPARAAPPAGAGDSRLEARGRTVASYHGAA